MGRKNIAGPAKPANNLTLYRDNGPSADLLREVSKDIEGMRTIADIEEELFVPTFFSTSLNRATGIGGWPLRRMAMVHGPEGVGKSVLALGVAESMRRFGHIPVIFDTEHSAETRWYNDLAFGAGTLFKMPQDMNELIDDVQSMLSKLRKMKAARTTAEQVGNIGYCFVVDTLTKLLPREALEKMQKEGVKKGYAISAMFSSLWSKSLIPQLHRLNSSMVVVVQNRENVDKGANPFAPKEKPSGGKAIKYDSSMIINVTHRKKLMRGKTEVLGAEHYFKVMKNKVDGAHMTTGCYVTSTGRGDMPVGFNVLDEALLEGVERGVIKTKTKDGNKRTLVNVDLPDGTSVFKCGCQGGIDDLRDRFKTGKQDLGAFVDALNQETRAVMETGREG